MSPFPILNGRQSDILAAKNGPNADRTVRQEEVSIDGNPVTVTHTYFPVGEQIDLWSNTNDLLLSVAELGDLRLPTDLECEPESISGLVIRDDSGWVSVNDVHIPFRRDPDMGIDERFAGGPMQGVSVRANVYLGTLDIRTNDSKIIGVFLKGEFVDKTKTAETVVVATPEVSDDDPPTIGAVVGEGARLSQLLPELELAQRIVDLYWPMYKHFVETTDAYILENFPQGRGEFDVIALANATFQKQGWDPSQYHEYTDYVANRSKARLDSAIAKSLTYAEVMAQIKNGVDGKPRFDDEWVSEALNDSTISFGNVVESLDAHGFAVIVGGNADEIIEKVKTHYLELADVVGGYKIESENGRHVVMLKDDQRPKPTAIEIRRRACLKVAFGSINAVFLNGKAHRLQLVETWDRSVAPMVLTDDKHDVWPVQMSAIHVEGIESDPAVDTTYTIELMGEVINSMLVRQEIDLRIDAIEFEGVSHPIEVGAWERVADQNGKFNFTTLGGRPVAVAMGEPVEGFDPTAYVKDLGELIIAGRQLKTVVLDPIEVPAIVESRPILRLRFDGDIQAFMSIVDNGQSVRAEDVLAVGGWLATELNSVIISRGDTEARLKIIDDNMGSNYTVSSIEVTNASYGPVYVSAV